MAPKISTHTHLSVPSSVTPAVAQRMEQCLGTAGGHRDVSWFTWPPAALGGGAGSVPQPWGHQDGRGWTAIAQRDVRAVKQSP